MSKKAAQKQIVYKIDSLEQWDELMMDKKRLLVIDLHLGWCGPAAVLD